MTGCSISTSKPTSISIDCELLMRAVRHHTDCPWVLLYIERWLKAPVQMEDGSLVARERGTPQGGVISPLLANLFLHYTFDIWMARNYPHIPFERYADDAICHCRRRKRRRRCGHRLRSGLRTASWCCIRRRPRSSTARTIPTRRLPRPQVRFSRLYVSAEAVAPMEGVRRLVQSRGQRQSSQVDPANCPTLDASSTQRQVAG